MSFDSRELRDALGQFSTGVCLVTVTDDHGVGHALTVNSFASVSLDPPLILWSLQRDSEVYDLFANAARFAVAVLSQDQQTASSSYARKNAHQLQPDHFQPGANGAPQIKDALVNFECSLERAMDGGDHTILLGRVTHVSPINSQPPLVFFGGRYRELQ